MENANLSNLIGIIYDCALEPERWNEALALIARATDSRFAFIVFHDLEHNVGARFFSYGVDEKWLSAYFEQFAPLNPIPAVSIVRPVGDVVTLQSLFPPQEWTSSAFYRGWVRPQRLGDMMGIMALRSDFRAGWLGLQRSEDSPDFGEADIALLNLLSPHICRSFRISDVLDLRTITSDAVGRTLDGLSAGVVLLDALGRVLHANSIAKDLIARGTVLRIVGGRLSAVDGPAQATLKQALAAKGEPRITGSHSIALPDSDGAGMLATVLPLDQGHRRHILAPFAATHAVFVQDTRCAPSLPMEAFAALYGLTQAEQRFLAVLMTGAKVKDASAMLGLAESTGRTHLSQLLAKTGTTKQSQLLKLLVSSAPPVRGHRALAPREQ